MCESNDYVMECRECGGIEFIPQTLVTIRPHGSLVILEPTGSTQFCCASCGAIIKEIENIRICKEV